MRRVLLFFGIFLSLFCFLQIEKTKAAGVFAYITTNDLSGTIAIIDTSTDAKIDNNIPLRLPYGVVVAPDGGKVYLTNDYLNIAIINTLTNTKIGNDIRAGVGAVGIAITPDGKTLYVANDDAGEVSVIDTLTNQKVMINISVGSHPFGVAITPDGKKVYVTHDGTASGDPANDTISVINTSTNKVEATIKLDSGSNPHGIAITRDGTKAYVANYMLDTVSVIDTLKDKVTATVSLLSKSGPFGIVITPDGTKAYITNRASSSVSIINTSTNKTIGSNIPVGFGPSGISITPDGSKVYVANNTSDSVSVIDTSTDKKIGTDIPVGSHPVAFGNFITPFAITSALTANGKVGKPFSYLLTAESYRPLKTFTVDSLPAGLTFDSKTHLISGTPTTAGKFNVNLTVSNDQISVSELLVLDIAPRIAPVITSALTAIAKIGEPFTYTFTATGDQPIALATSPLPNGLTFNSATGVISGTPTVEGSFNITLIAVNDAGTNNQTLVLKVASRFTPVITSALTATGKVGQPFSYTFTVTGDQPIALDASPLPNGLSFDSNTGVISGVPTADGTFNIHLSATHGVTTITDTLILTIAKADASATDSPSSGGGCSLIESQQNNFKISSLLFLMGTGLISLRRRVLKK